MVFCGKCAYLVTECNITDIKTFIRRFMTAIALDTQFITILLLAVCNVSKHLTHCGIQGNDRHIANN